MAQEKCDKCNQKLSKKDKECKYALCVKCRKDSDDGATSTHVLVSEFLMYANHHRKTSSKDSLVNALSVFFSPDDVKEAQALLWSEFEDKGFLPEVRNRRDSPNRTETMALCEDVICALAEIEEQGIVLSCHAKFWNKIPKAAPESTHEVSVANKVAELESRLSLYDHALATIRADVTNNLSRIVKAEDEGKTHGQLIQQVIAADAARDKEWPRPSGLGTSSNSTSNNAANNVNVTPAPVAAAAPPVVLLPANTNSTTVGVNGISGGRQRCNSTPNVGALTSETERPFIRQSWDRRRQQRQEQRQDRRNTTNQDNNINQQRQGGRYSNQGTRSMGARATVIGQASGTGLNAAPMPSRDFFIWRVQKGTTVDQMGQYIRQKGVDYRELVQMNHAESANASFKLSVSFSDADKLRDSSFWPDGIWVRKWRS